MKSAAKSHKALSLPGLGRVGVFREQSGQGSGLVGLTTFETNLSACVVRNGRPATAKELMSFWSRFWGNVHANDTAINLGSGLVTNVGVNLMAWNDEASTLGATLSLMQYQAIGTGTTAAAATDYYLQTPQGATNLSGTTNGYMTATNSVTVPNTIKSVATFTATGSIAVTEWALTMSNAASFSGTATATSSTSLTNSGASFTTSGNGLKGWTVEASSSAVNTPTTTVQGLVTANTGTALTVANGWWTLANASGTTPSGTTSYVVYPTAWDHKVFSSINLVSGDSLQTTYSVAVNSGG